MIFKERQKKWYSEKEKVKKETVCHKDEWWEDTKNFKDGSEELRKCEEEWKQIKNRQGNN